MHAVRNHRDHPWHGIIFRCLLYTFLTVCDRSLCLPSDFFAHPVGVEHIADSTTALVRSKHNHARSKNKNALARVIILQNNHDDPRKVTRPLVPK